jgi:LL-diaminopimelate aminotransferase
MQEAKRMQVFSAGIFNQIEQRKNQLLKKGKKVIDLSVGSPDRPPAPHIIEALHQSIDNPLNYRYPLEGLPRLYQAVAQKYQERFKVSLDPDKEILVLMGTQDGLAHISLAYVNPGEIALVPDPGYPIYAGSIFLTGGKVYPLPLLPQNNFLPDLNDVPEKIARQAKIIWLNYPNNPLAAVAEREFFQQVVAFARRYDILVCHDAAYAELAYDGYQPISFLEIPGAREVGVEFFSLSKTYNLAGCRIGFVLGKAEVIATLKKLKSNIDYGVFKVVQEAGIAALEGPQEYVTDTVSTYQRRRDILADGMKKLGWPAPKPKASMFIWAPLPWGYTSSQDFALTLLEETGILVIPGLAFGARGEGYVRIALVEEEEVLIEAIKRIEKSSVRG